MGSNQVYRSSDSCSAVGLAEDLVQEARADDLARVRRHDGTPPVLVAEEMMAPFDAQNTKAGLRERPDQFGARDSRTSGSCRNGDALNANEFRK
jgi:hypothetical protein